VVVTRLFLDGAHVPLSQSRLWERQRAWFDEQGIRAWNKGSVPQYITSNVWISTAYAHVAAAWIRQLPDVETPATIVELGCGSGRFGILFVRKLLELLAPPEGRSPFRYVFTDLSEYNLDILRNHPSLQPMVSDGSVDFGRYDAEESEELLLTESGERISRAAPRPLIVIANYLFDGLRNDCFRFRDGQLEQIAVQATLPSDADEGFEGVMLSCDVLPARQEP
jgi:hypothetical protein